MDNIFAVVVRTVAPRGPPVAGALVWRHVRAAVVSARAVTVVLTWRVWQPSTAAAPLVAMVCTDLQLDAVGARACLHLSSCE